MQTTQRMSRFYQQMGHSAHVASADPHELISLLLKQARSKLALAVSATLNHDLATRAQSIHRVCAIIDALRLSLDSEAGGEIARNLEDLYDYLYRRLMQASAMNDEQALHEADRLLAILQEGWNGIAQQEEPALDAG